MSIRAVLNPNAARLPYGPAQESAISRAGADAARRNIREWPVYAPTPLLELRSLASQLGLERLWVKNEGSRQPLLSFKALGAAYALGEALRDRIEAATGMRPASHSLWCTEHIGTAAGLHAVAATDGNHGRSLAWGASEFGCACTIFLPAGVSASREAAIARFGARTIRVEGNYEDALAAASAEADRTNGLLIQDTAIAGHELGCRRIMEGYMLMTEEVREQLPKSCLPTHVFVQVGCGGLAAAVAADWWLSGYRPTIVLVEPVNADCMLRSIERGRPTIVEGNHETIMIGLAVGEVSTMAWDILRTGSDVAVSIDDAPAREAMRRAARPSGTDPRIVMGETGAAGLAACLEACRNPEIASMLGLSSGSRILLFNTEGAVDPESYAKIIDRAGET